MFLLTIFVVNSEHEPRKRYKRVATTTSGTPFDFLSPEVLTLIARHLDLRSLLGLSSSCKYFNLFINGSEEVSLPRFSVLTVIFLSSLIDMEE